MDAYDKALELLAGREHTAWEIEKKLREKGYSEEDTTEAVSLLTKEGALSDERFAEIFIRSRLRKSAEGKQILMLRLLQRGVAKDVASAALEKAWNEEEYLESLKREWNKLEKKYGQDKATDKLRMKAFTLSEIRRARETEDDEDQ